jgi:hypothetical protein
MKKVLSFLLLFLAVVVFATWQYRLLCILLFVLLNKGWIKSLPLMARHEHSYKMIVASLSMAIFIAIPNYFQHGRTQLFYLDDAGRRIATPMNVYLLNVLFPEEEVMNAGMKATALLPPSSLSPYFKNLGNRFIRDAQRDFWNGKALTFYWPYNKLSLQGSNPGSFTIAQAHNEIFGTYYDGVYITKPKHYDKEKTYPVVFFAHGYLGSWELYQGLFSSLDNCFVVGIGTRDLSGIFGYNDINKIFTKYQPMLREQGYSIEENHLHLIGLSNGGTASNVALGSFSNRFQTITYLSTSCNVIKHSRAKVLMIGGGKDVSASNLPSASRQLQRCGTKTALYFDQDENHYIMVHQQRRILKFLNQEMK